MRTKTKKPDYVETRDPADWPDQHLPRCRWLASSSPPPTRGPQIQPQDRHRNPSPSSWRPWNAVLASAVSETSPVLGGPSRTEVLRSPAAPRNPWDLLTLNQIDSAVFAPATKGAASEPRRARSERGSPGNVGGRGQPRALRLCHRHLPRSRLTLLAAGRRSCLYGRSLLALEAHNMRSRSPLSSIRSGIL